MTRLLDVIKEKQKSKNFSWLTLIDADKSTSVSFTYDDLRQEINKFLDYFQKKQIQQGDIILIIEKESLALFASFFAGIIYGAIPAFYPYPSPKQSTEQFLKSIDHLVSYNQIKMILTFSEVADILVSFQKDQESSILEIDNIKKIPATTNDLLQKISCAEEFFLQFSSGTTGGKKGVKLSTQSLFNQISAYKKVLNLNTESTFVSWLPHYHDMGLIACMMLPFIEGVPIVMLSPFQWVKQPQILLDAIKKYAGTHVWLPNFSLGHLCNNCAAKDSDLSSLQQIICCSEPVLEDSVKRFVQCFSESGVSRQMIKNCYAMAENTFAMTSTTKDLSCIHIDYDLLKNDNKVVEKEGGYPLISAGKCLDNIQIKILNETKQTLPQNHIGEIHIKSDCMLSEYHNNPQATAAAFHDGWFNTEDLGFLHNEELYITGRKKELIIVGGENIYPQDIEQILNSQQYFIPGRNVVFGVGDDRVGTEKIIAIAEIEKDAENNIDIPHIKSLIFSKLNISVASILLLPKATLVKSTAGKISRHLNKIKYLQNAFDDKFLYGLQNSKHDPVVEIVKKHILDKNCTIDEQTNLIESGLIDSFSFSSLVKDLEIHFAKKLPQNMLRFELFKNIQAIRATFGTKTDKAFELKQDIIEQRKQSLSELRDSLPGKQKQTPLELLLNYFPFPKTIFYIWLLRLVGIKVGKKVSISGRIFFKIRGKTSNIIIGDYVRIGKGVDLRNRENGKIYLGTKSYLDSFVRIVAARDGKVELHEGVELGAHCIINSGGVVTIGKYTMIAGNVNINSSSHGTEINTFIKKQPHSHGEIKIGEDVWIGSGASILMNSHIGAGAVVSSNSLVSGAVRPYSLVAGVPATFIKYR